MALATVMAAIPVAALPGPVGADDPLAGSAAGDGSPAAAMPDPIAGAAGSVHRPDGILMAPVPGSNSGQAAMAADQAASASSQLAADLLREATVEADATEAGAAAGRRQAASSAQGQQGSAPGRSDPANGEIGDLRSAGKAALRWIARTIPWLSDLEADAKDAEQAVEGAVEWVGAGLPGGAAGGSGIGSSGLHGGSPGGNYPSPGASGEDGLPHDGSAGNHSARDLMRDVVEAIKTIIGHPMTWLVIGLMIAGGIAMSIGDRRPK